MIKSKTNVKIKVQKKYKNNSQKQVKKKLHKQSREPEKLNKKQTQSAINQKVLPGMLHKTGPLGQRQAVLFSPAVLMESKKNLSRNWNSGPLGVKLMAITSTLFIVPWCRLQFFC